MINRVITAEWIKSKHSFTPWFVGIGILLIPLVGFLIFLNRWTYFVPEPGSNGWEAYYQLNLGLSASLMLPVWNILLVALVIHPEQKGNTWKRLFITPVGKSALYGGKLMYLYLLLALTVIGFTLAVVLTGVTAQFLHPELVLRLNAVPFTSLLFTGIGLMVCLLPILTIQYVFSMLTNNVLIPAAVGLFMVIVSTVLAQGWSYAVYDPYAFPLLFSWNESGKTTLPDWLGIASIEWMSVLIVVLVGWLGWLRFRRMSVR